MAGVPDHPKKYPALRISQLEANFFEDEIYHFLKAQLAKVFKYSKTTFFLRCQPEVKVALKSLLWWFSVYKNGANLGQRLFQSRYGSTTNAGSRLLDVNVKIWVGALQIGAVWLYERLEDICQIIFWGYNRAKVANVCRIVEVIIEVLSLANFLVFLQTGMYSNLTERLLGITHVFDTKQKIRKVDYEFMNRELLWHGFSEFLFFVIPFINFHKLKNTIKRIISATPKGLKGASVLTNTSTCSFCNERPTNLQRATCGHVFCYYCYRANILSDSSVECPECGQMLKLDL